MKTILATAYAINPYKGSEDATGWQYALQIARFNQLVIYTRKNNRPDIDRFIIENNDIGQISNIKFRYYDTPYWLRFWKKGGRGALLYYYLWQFGLALFLKKNEQNYDVVHNLNFHNNWTPTFLWLLKKPLVWGPVAFHPKIPKSYTHNFSLGNRIKNTLTWWVKKSFWALDPFLKISKKKAFKVIAPNEEAFNLLGVKQNKRVRLFSVASEDHKERVPEPVENRFKVLSVGRFVDLKGFDIAVKSFHLFWKKLDPHQKKTARLVMVGKGPQLGLLENYIKTHELENCIEIIDWIKREDLKEHYKSSSCFLFCSHEGAGMVVPEAMSYGNPVLCFDNIGPGLMINENCGIAVPYTDYEQSLHDFAEGLYTMYSDVEKLKAFSNAAKQRFQKELTWDKKGEVLKEIYEQAS